MESLPTFIKIHMLFAIMFLIPAASSVTNINSQIDIDENNRSISNSDLELETSIVNRETDIETEYNYFLFSAKADEDVTQIKPDFWTTLHSIESKQGRLLYRPSNKNRNCATTASPCGHHQLSLQALKDISCVSKQCLNDREVYTKSLAMSKQLQAINNKRLKKAGYTDLPEYQKYLIHQQGATGLKIILGASSGKKLLSRNMKKNMAGNSPYSYKKLKSFGSRLAAKKFLKHWEKKWKNEKDLVIAANITVKSVEAIIKSEAELNLPLFNEYELQIALNLKM